jgi:hypothetical protein
MINKNFLMLGTAAFGLISTAVLAGEPRLLKAYGAWDAYAYEEGGSRVCYMAAKPDKDEGAYKARGDIHALITHRPGDGTKNVFTYIAGYTYKPATDASVEIDGQKFALFTKDSMAWALNTETDNQIAEAIRTGSKMIVTGVSSRGTKTVDTFSLNGSSSAHDRISQECGS